MARKKNVVAKSDSIFVCGLSAVVLVVSFAVYAFTAYPDLVGGDGAEFAAVACASGISHPPGYPLFTLLAKLFLLLPIAELPAARINIMSSVFASLAAGLLFLFVWRWLKSWPTAILATALFAFAPVVWEQAIQAEVFSLNNLLALVFLNLVLSYWQTQQLKLLYWTALFFGLGIANHHSIVFVVLPVVAWTVWRHLNQLKTFKFWFLAFACFLIGSLPYIYLPLVSSDVTPMTWGETGTWRGFWIHVLRREYGTLSLGTFTEGPQFLNGLTLFFSRLPSQTLYLGPLLALVALSSGFKAKDKFNWAWLFAFSFLFYLIVFHYLANLPLQYPLQRAIVSRFWQLPLLFFVLLIAYGYNSLMQAKPNAKKAFVAMALFVSILQIVINFKDHNRSDNRIVSQFARNILNSLPENSVLISFGDEFFFPLNYLQLCEQKRPSIQVINLDNSALWWFQSYAQKAYPRLRIEEHKRGTPLSLFLRDNEHKFPIFISKIRSDQQEAIKRSHYIWPYGHVLWLKNKGGAFDLDKYVENSNRILENYPIVDLAELHDESWEHIVTKQSWQAEPRRARRLIEFSQQQPKNWQALNYGADILASYLSKHPRPPLHLIKNLGTAYQQLIGKSPDAKKKMVKTWEQYLSLAGQDSPDVEKIRSILSKYK